MNTKERRAWLQQVLSLAEDEDALLAAATAMRHDVWWTTVPKRDEPEPVAGEIACR